MFLTQKIFFIGIGGIGMSAIAEILHHKGFKITGSDKTKNNITNRLKKNGIKIFHSHKKDNIRDVDIIVHSTAIKKNNIELLEAKRLKIPIYSRAMMLAEVMRLKPSITVAGSHGKTTTTSLISNIFESAGHDPTVINGGIINNFGANAKLGKGTFIIAEADESDGSFTLLPSTIGIINNIDLEHIDFYKNLSDIKKRFIEYANRIPFYGFLSICNDDRNTRSIIKHIGSKPLITFGIKEESNFQAKNIRVNKNLSSIFDLEINFEKKRIIKNISVPLIGEHNILNTLCAISIAYQLKISIKEILQGLQNFSGVKRRFSILYNKNSNLIIDDYGHHPKEIKSTVNSLKTITKNRIIAIFEPHRYSRLNKFINEFINAFSNADYIFILPIYSAGEKNLKKVDNIKLSELFKKKFRNKEIYSSNNEKLMFKNLKKLLVNNNNFIFLGAGSSSQIAQRFVNYLDSNVKNF